MEAFVPERTQILGKAVFLIPKVWRLRKGLSANCQRYATKQTLPSWYILRIG